ncbi:MAG: glycosyltransferase family 39 protein [Crocinitomicaceae bacterium]|nr:glycosyltransferase family 39 protein [Flavobacteriales bacterium]NQZ35439.1 glycosyltransferase family 39 protein [Crocinitomicaceae bacterium]
MGENTRQSKRKNILTKLSGLIIFLIVLVSHFQEKKWNDPNLIISGDVQVYYAYLPAYFIHDDIDFVNPEVYHTENHLRLQYAENPNGDRYIRSTCGMAIVYAPFFFIGHWAASALGEPMDGFSYPYMFSLVIGTLLFLALGLLFLSKLLLRYFDDRTVSITLLVLYLGTNFFYYLTGTILYPHGFSFTLLVIVLYGTINWLEKPSIKWTLIIGFLAGLLVLIRPVDVLFVVFLPLIGVLSLKQFKERLQLLWGKKLHLLLMLVAGLVIMIPQFIYNYHLSGKLIFNMYAHSGERFFFTNPHLIDSLFSYRNGWLVYSPLMIFSLIGIVLMLRQRNQWIRYVLPVFLIYYFVLASWWCWWYAGFGNRAYINMYPFLAISLATAVQFFLQRSFVVRSGFKLILFTGILLSLFQVNQFTRGVIHWGEMTKGAYWDVFLKEKPSELYSTYLRVPNVVDRKKGLDRIFEPKVELIYQKDFSFDAGSIQDSSMALFVKNGIVEIPGETEFFGDIPLPISKDINEVYLTVWVKGADEGEMHITLTNTEQTFAKISSEVVKQDGDWKQFHCYVQVPDAFLKDTLHFKIWNQARKDLEIDRVRLQGMNRSFESVDE